MTGLVNQKSLLILQETDALNDMGVKTNSNRKASVYNEQHRHGTSGSSALQINEDGIWNTYYLPGANVIDDGKTVKYLPPTRFYLMKTNTTDFKNPENYYKLIL